MTASNSSGIRVFSARVQTAYLRASAATSSSRAAVLIFLIPVLLEGNSRGEHFSWGNALGQGSISGEAMRLTILIDALHFAKLRRRSGLTRPSQNDAADRRSARIAPAARARSMIRPTVDTLRWPPLRASLAWMRALPMNGYLRRTSITALTPRGFQARCRIRRGRVDFRARPRPAADPELRQCAFLAAPRGAQVPARVQVR